MTLLFQIGQGILAVIGLLCVLSFGCVFALGLWAVPGNEEEPDWDTPNYDPETGGRRQEFSEPATDARIEGREILAPSPQQYSDLPPQWSLNDDAWLPPLPESAYTPESTPLPPPAINGQPVLEDTQPVA